MDPASDPLFDLVAHPDGLSESFFVTARERRRVVERPVQARRDAREDWAALGGRLVAHADDVLETPSRLEEVEDRLSRVAADVDADQPHRLDREGVQPAGLDPGALHLEAITGDLLQEGRRHLAAGRVVNAKEQD